MLGGLGIGGTTRTFSPFGIINTTLGATGGIGGTTTPVLADESRRTGLGPSAWPRVSTATWWTRSGSSR